VHFVFVLGVYDKLGTRYVQISVCVHLVFVLDMYNKLETRYAQCRCECTLYSCLVCDIYKVSVLANLPDSDAVYTNYRNIGPSESPGFGYIPSIGASARTCVPCLIGNRPMTLSRVGLYLLGGLRSRSVSRVSSVAWQSCVAGLCGVIGRGVPRRATGENI